MGKHEEGVPVCVCVCGGGQQLCKSGQTMSVYSLLGPFTWTWPNLTDILRQVLNILIIQWIMCLKCGALYPSYVNQVSLGNKQQSSLVFFFSFVFGCYSYAHQLIWFHKCWFITDSSSLHIGWCHLFSGSDGSHDSSHDSVRGELEDHVTKPLLKDNKIILNLKCTSHIMEEPVVLVQ